jgi:hypothetical protein
VIRFLLLLLLLQPLSRRRRGAPTQCGGFAVAAPSNWPAVLIAPPRCMRAGAQVRRRAGETSQERRSHGDASEGEDDGPEG